MKAIRKKSISGTVIGKCMHLNTFIIKYFLEQAKKPGELDL